MEKASDHCHHLFSVLSVPDTGIEVCSRCSICRKFGTEYVCLSCYKYFCPQHYKLHYQDPSSSQHVVFAKISETPEIFCAEHKHALDHEYIGPILEAIKSACTLECSHLANIVQGEGSLSELKSAVNATEPMTSLLSNAYGSIFHCGHESKCEYDSDIWICLGCGAIRCNEGLHILEHCADTDHNMAVSIRDKTGWCYECSSSISHPLLSIVLNILDEGHMLKFESDREKKEKSGFSAEQISEAYEDLIEKLSAPVPPHLEEAKNELLARLNAQPTAADQSENKGSSRPVPERMHPLELLRQHGCGYNDFDLGERDSSTFFNE